MYMRRGKPSLVRCVLELLSLRERKKLDMARKAYAVAMDDGTTLAKRNAELEVNGGEKKRNSGKKVSTRRNLERASYRTSRLPEWQMRQNSPGYRGLNALARLYRAGS